MGILKLYYKNYYTCTKDILAGLGGMYTADEHFKENIDKNAVGTADFTSEAISVLCKATEKQ